MIGLLRGRIVHLDRDRGEVLVELSSGIGYKVSVNTRTMERLDPAAESVLYTYHQFIRDGEQRLVGFLTRDEVVALETLVATPKVGPAMALSILNTYGPSELAVIVSSDDVDALCAVSGVGRTTAQRVMVEMKNKLVVDLSDPNFARIGSSGTAPGNDARADVADALLALGYSVAQARTATGHLPEHLVAGADAGILLKEALRHIEAGQA